jgi:hypothetical protein
VSTLQQIVKQSCRTIHLKEAKSIDTNSRKIRTLEYVIFAENKLDF